MNVRCNFCGHSFSLGRDYMIEAVSDAEEKNQKYHTLECINCRKKIKVSLKQLRHYVPRAEADESQG